MAPMGQKRGNTYLNFCAIVQMTGDDHMTITHLLSAG